MKKLGMLGGMSYESTAVYYQLINHEINKQLKSSHSAEIIMYSFDYDELEKRLEKHLWQEIEDRMVEEAYKLISVGAECIMLCANTIHQIAPGLEKKISVPLIHIVKETYKEVKKMNLKKVGLIGTKYTMESTMYPSYFNEHGIEVIVPDQHDQQVIHDIIYKELIIGNFNDESRQKILHIIDHMHVDGIILGCTELPMLIKKEHLPIHRFDTMEIHAKAAAKWMLSDTYDL
jgi:aspartate racemase